MVEVSFITFTRNSAHRLRGLLEHVKDVVDEIIVVDGYSTDETIDIARSYGARVYERRPWGYAEPDRMFALKQASYDWILYLDDDERLSTKLKNDLKSLIESAESDGTCAFSMARVNLTPRGKPILGPFYPDRQTRLFKKEKALYRGLVHEFPLIQGKVKILPEEYYIIHFWNEFWSKKQVRYVQIQALQYFKPSHPSKIRRALWYLLPASSMLYYFYMLYAYSLRGKISFNLEAIVYTIRKMLYDSLFFTLIKIRGKKREKIAKLISEKGFIQLLKLDI
jgi:glycosyltransferase involved in cell wall biosynthesis